MKNNIESTIKEIKKAEVKREFENAMEGYEAEAIAEAVKNEIPTNEKKDELEQVFEREKLIEKMEFNPEIKERSESKERLKKYMEGIYDKVKPYIDTYDLIKPSGRIENGERLSLEEEHKIFKKEIKNNPDYNPIYTYPLIEEIKREDIEKTIKYLEEKKEDIIKDPDENTRLIALEHLESMGARVNFILAEKDKNDKMVYEYSVLAYDDIYEDLVKINESYYQDKFKDNSAYNNPLREKLKKIKITSEDLKDIFEIVKDVLGIKGFNVELRKDEEGISVSDTEETIKIPKNKKYSVYKAIGLASHEVTTHVISIENSKAAGFPGIYAGKNATTFQEGIAMYTEQKTEEHIFGDSWPNDKDWFIHAMDCRRKGNGFGRVYLEMKERIKNQLIAQKFDENIVENESENKALMVCRRIFRGMNDLSSNSKYCYTKDGAYFRGYIESIKMAKYGLDHYFTDLRVDPSLLPYFISLKAIPEKALYANRKVMEALWKKNGFIRNFLENEDVQRDRAMAYGKEFGQIDREVEEAKEEMKKNN
jgi:hypothetical protein